MIFSLAVIVCEQQTLFAPHYTTYGGTSLVASDTTNSLVPIAGVNRLVPLPGHRVRGDGDNEGYKVRDDVSNGAIAIPALMRPDMGNSLEHGPGLHDSLQPIPDPNMHLPAPTPVERPVLGPIAETCPPCQLELRLGIFDESGTGGRF